MSTFAAEWESFAKAAVPDWMPDDMRGFVYAAFIAGATGMLHAIHEASGKTAAELELLRPFHAELSAALVERRSVKR